VGHFGLQMLRRNHLGLFSDSPHLPENFGRKVGMARSFKDPAAMIAWAAPWRRVRPGSGCFPRAEPRTRAWRLKARVGIHGNT
jgi:hypothetical protein